MPDNTEILELKFEGSGINPAAVSASEIAELIKNFESAILSIASEKDPGILRSNSANPFITLQDIGNRSLGIRFIAQRSLKVIVPAYLTIATSFEHNSYNDIPDKAIENIKTFTKFARRHNCNASWIRGTKKVGSFQSDTEITLDDNRYLRGETTIYGELLRIGGETPRITIKINNDYTISFEIKKELAVLLSSKLYNEIGLIGTAKWEKSTYRVIDFKAESIIDIDAKPLSDTFKDLNSLLWEHLKDIDDINSYIT